jgi:protein involved in temperature-dependent protein secretion
MDQLLAAFGDGDYVGLCKALRASDMAAAPAGKAMTAVFLALIGEYDEARRLRASAPGFEPYDGIIEGERQRAARQRDPQAAGALSAAEPLPFLGVYAGMAVALLQRDEALIPTIQRDAAAIPPVPGRLVGHDGKVRTFRSILDSDDAIGQMLEAYTASGLLYVPFASLRRIELAPPRSLVDRLVPRTMITMRNGGQSMVFVPLLYAGSTTHRDDTIRTGRMTTWDYCAGARRALGQRDFVLDGTPHGGVTVGMQGVQAIDLG